MVFYRKIFTLPHPSAISNWTSTVNAEPGFFKEVLLRAKSFEDDDKFCNLVLDGMAIKKEAIPHPTTQNIAGFCNFGEEMNICLDDPTKPAVEALVFMLVSLNGKWKWPIGYFLQSKSTSSVQAQLISTAIEHCANVGLKVMNVTCDGTHTNVATFEHLGCVVKSDLNNMQTNFLHPKTGNFVNFMLDPSHIIKLARNCLASYGKIQSTSGVIDWKYISELEKIQNEIGLKFANKLSKKHVAFKNNIIKVKLAAQVLSSSVANAIEFLREVGVEEFSGSEATVEFIRNVDRLFDFLNSRNPFNKGFKSPIFKNNIDFLEKEMLKLLEYLFVLKDMDGKTLAHGKKQAFIIGFATAVKSSLAVARSLFCESGFKYLLTYKLSQDHIELLFSKIRKRFGHNNNANVLQFKTAMKKILLKNYISSSTLGIFLFVFYF